MPSADDDEFREIARGIEEKVPEWIVLWVHTHSNSLLSPYSTRPRE